MLAVQTIFDYSDAKMVLRLQDVKVSLALYPAERDRLRKVKEQDAFTAERNPFAVCWREAGNRAAPEKSRGNVPCSHSRDSRVHPC